MKCHTCHQELPTPVKSASEMTTAEKIAEIRRMQREIDASNKRISEMKFR